MPIAQSSDQAFTWLDILKLSVPVGTAFAAIWAKASYEHRKEVKLLQETLLRGFDRGPLTGAACIGLLHETAAEVKAGEVSVLNLFIPSIIAKTCERLAVIDATRADLYTDHLGVLAYVDFTISQLKDLHKSYLTSVADPPSRLTNAVASAAQVAMEAFVALEKSQLAIAQSFSKAGPVQPTAAALEQARKNALEAEAAFAAKRLTRE